MFVTSAELLLTMSSIFRSTGLNNSYVTQIILGTVNVIMTIPGLYFVERFGRRKCLIAGALWMFVCFMVFASVGHFALDQHAPETTPQAGVAMIVFACLFIAAFASTWGPMVWAVVAELYPARYRAKCMAVSTASNWLWNFLTAFFTPFITSAIDFRYGYVFAACCLAAAGVVDLFLMESQGKTLEEVDTMYIRGVWPEKSAPKSARKSNKPMAPGTKSSVGQKREVFDTRDVNTLDTDVSFDGCDVC